MIVDPDFLDHWRTHLVSNMLGDDPLAPLYIIRLWAHCQNRKSDEFDIPPAGIKAICRYQADAQTLEEALISAEYMQRDGIRVTIVGWAEKNASLISAWENGRKGGRPRTREKTHGLPTGNPRATQAKPIREEKIREENPPLPPGGGAPDGAGRVGVVFPELEDLEDHENLVEAVQQDAGDLPAAPAAPADAVTTTTPEQAVCAAMTAAGIPDARPGDPRLQAMLKVGADMNEFVTAAKRSLDAGKGFGYAIGIVAGERRRAAELVGQLPPGALPPRPERPSSAQAQADLARTTVPGRKGRDPILVQLEAEAKTAAPMPTHVRAHIAALLGRVAA